MGVKLGNEDFSYSIGQHVTGFVYKLDSEWIWLTMSRHVKAQLYVLDSSCEPTELQEFQKRYTVGKAISGYILSANKEKKLLRFVLRLIYSAPDRTLGCETTKIDDTSNHLNGNVAYHIHEGDVGGRISKILPGVGGMLIKIDPHRYGKVHFTELTDLWVSDPLSGYHVGLCHISELSDDHVNNIETKYRARERVTSKVLKVDEDRQRVSLRMKKSYFMSNYDIQAPSKQKYDDAIEEKDHMNLDFECENGQHLLLAEVEARASILPLEVPLDDIEKSDMVNAAFQNIEHVDDADAVDQKNKSQAKKKANEEREREIRAAEERLLEKDIPRSADEFEKVVRISPNSSFVWIKYMAFMLSLADVEKARSIAERALKTINIREESEKLNVWVAYFNLENEYGYPPEDAASKIFGRALQYCDPKKVHLALLGMHERIEQHKLADLVMWM
ncbi:rRNA biogenesis protein RRP5-like [Camellia sinensis]|uniref:rRNA biogenesis protein RRP5-like n=1 Tax=Camellia sinensis TaxID=4442 RepID=UPI0010355149|nr:rRNA biogenesis protein RRP5-like [Camellia sinensis]